jgi:uncharacterized protein
MRILAALVCGAIFGAGLTIGQMVDPRKVLNFLDVAGIASGTWDPTLLMVFSGALATVFAAYAIQRRMSKPVLAPTFEIPTRSDIDARLVGGSALFGVGWGLAGVCPGPSIAALPLAGMGSGGLASFALFVAAMCAGMVLVRVAEGRCSRRLG